MGEDSPLLAADPSRCPPAIGSARAVLMAAAACVCTVLVLAVLVAGARAPRAGGGGRPGDAWVATAGSASASLSAHGFVTVVAACKLGEDRKPAYKTALRSWLQLPSDVVEKVVIVDWSSDFDLAATTTREISALCASSTLGASLSWLVSWLGTTASPPRACGGKSVDVHKVTPTDIAWKLSAAVNFAVFHGVTGTNATKYILKVDCDTHLSPRFFDTNDPREDDDRTFRYANFLAARVRGSGASLTCFGGTATATEQALP
jgi:hypothetical protein